MVSCPSGLFIMYVCPMLPLYADSQPAWTRPSATPTEAPKPSRETAPCIKSHPHYSSAVAWRRQLGAPQCAQIAPPASHYRPATAHRGPFGRRPSKAFTGTSVRVHKSRLVNSPCFPCSFSNPVHCRSTARSPPAAQPSNALPSPFPAPSPALPQSLVLPRKPLLPPKHHQPQLEQTV